MKKRSRSGAYSGLSPQKGWPMRNAKFLRHRIIPGMFRKAQGEVRELLPHPPEKNCVRITWIGHASFFIQFSHTSLIIDPNWAKWHGPVKRQRQPGLSLENFPEIDLVLVTHAHFDHLHKPSLKILRAKQGIILPVGSGSLVRKLGFPKVQEMQTWDELDMGEIKIIHTPCHHWGARYVHDTHREYGGYLLQSAEYSIFHGGDSTYFDGFKEIGRRHQIDIAILPIGAYESPSGRDVHMNPEQALQAFLDLGAKVFIPMHYGTFPLGNEELHEPIERLLVEAERLHLSEAVFIPEEGIAIEW